MHGTPGTAVTRTFTSTSAATASEALTQGGTYLFQCTEDCHIEIAVSPTATTSDTILFAGVPYIFNIPNETLSGTLQDYKVAAIRKDTDGILFITPMNPVNG